MWKKDYKITYDFIAISSFFIKIKYNNKILVIKFKNDMHKN